MTFKGDSSHSKRKYAKISLKKRQTLVDLVLNQGSGLTKMAKKLNIKLSTAKLILRKFKRTWQFHIRRTKKVTLGETTIIQKEEQKSMIDVVAQQFQKVQKKSSSQVKIPQFIQQPANMYWQFPFLNYYPFYPLDKYYQI